MFSSRKWTGCCLLVGLPWRQNKMRCACCQPSTDGSRYSGGGCLYISNFCVLGVRPFLWEADITPDGFTQMRSPALLALPGEDWPLNPAIIIEYERTFQGAGWRKTEGGRRTLSGATGILDWNIGNLLGKLPFLKSTKPSILIGKKNLLSVIN